MVPDIDIPVLFRGGIERKLDTNDGLSMLSKLYVLQNMVFDDQETVIQRGGTEAETLTALGTGQSVSGAKRLFTRGDELVIEATSGLHRLVPSTGTTQVRARLKYGDSSGNDKFLRASKLETPVSGHIERWFTSGSSVPAKSTNYDHAQANGVSVWAWEERDVNGAGRLAVRVMAIREADGAVLVDEMRTTGTNPIRACPRVVWCEGATAFYIYYAKWSSGGVTYDIVRDSLEGPTYSQLGGEQTVLTNGGGAGGTVGNPATQMPLFDLDCRATNIGLVYKNHDTPTLVEMKFIDATDGYTILGGDTSTTATNVSSLSAMISSGGGADSIFAFYACENDSNVYASSIVDDGFYTFGHDLVTMSSAPAGTDRIGRITGVDDNYQAAGGFTVVYEYSTAAYASPPTSANTVRIARGVSKTTAATGTSSDCFASWFIHGRIAVLKARMLLPVAFLEPEGSSVFLVDLQGYADNGGTQRPLVVARIGAGEAGYIYNEWHRGMRLPACSIDDDDVLTVPFMKWVADVQVAGGALVTPVQLTRADIDTSSQLGALEVAGTVLLAGACPHVYDGAVAVEMGSHHRPYIFSATTGAGSDLPAAGTYYICAAQQWTDAQGNLHIGPPSNVVTVTVAGAASVTFVTGVPTAQRTPDNLVYYRTKAGSTGPFYRMFDVNGVGVSDSTMAPTTAFALVPDTLYSTGAAGEELPNDPCPSHRQACVWQGRVWLAGCDDGYALAFSKEVQQAFAPEFSVEFKRRVPLDWGRVVSVQPLGDRLAVFCEKKVGQLFGNGPTVAGEQDGYSQVIPLVEGLGARWDSPLSSIVTPQGVWFASQHGLRCIGPGGQVLRGETHELGAEVDPLVVGSLIAVRVAGKQQVRWHHTANTALVWDYQWQQWSEFGGKTQWQTSGTASNSTTTYHLKGDTLLKYNESIITDQGSAVTMSLFMHPLQLSGILGFQRLRRLYVLGRGPTANVTVTLNGQYDYDDSAAPTTMVNAVAATPESASRFVFEHHLARQKCEALRLSFTFSVASGTSRLRLTGMRLRAGVKTKHTKLPSARRV